MTKLCSVLAFLFMAIINLSGHPEITSSENRIACNVNVTSSNGGITITGLTSDANVKLFNANISSVSFSCNPWQGNSCSATETVSGLTVGATYFLSVQSSECNEWIPIVVEGGGGGGGPFSVNNCPEDISIIVPHGGDYSTIVDWDPPTGTTDCPQGGLTITRVSGPAPGLNFVTVATARSIVYEIKDACGNSEFCFFTLRLSPEATVVTCPPDVTVTATSAQGAVVTYDFPSMVTFCSPLPWQLNNGLPSGSVFPIGTTAINYSSFLSGPAGFCQTTQNCNINITVLPPNGGCTVEVSSADSDIFITGLNGDSNVKIFDANFDVVFACNPWQTPRCSNSSTAFNLDIGTTYFVSVVSSTCNEWIPIVVQGSGGCNDADGDGVCDNEDCQPNNAAIPATPGTACNDFNSNTTNDVIQSNGCDCQGTSVGGGCNVNITSANGGVTITGLASNANAKLFNSNTQAVWGCNPWQNNPCSNNESVTGLTPGATYFLSVQSSSCDEWIPIVIQGGSGGGSNLPDLSVNSVSIGSGAPGAILGFTFNLVNQGNSTASGSYSIKSYVSADASLSSNDIQEGTINTGNTGVGTVSVNGAITVPNLSAGTYFLFVVVDDGNNIGESNESNNVAQAQFTITGSSGGGGGCNLSNVAQGKSATQSSTLNFGDVNSGAAKAVDGNTNGNYFSGSVAATNSESQAWWQVDLGGLYEPESIQIFNRTEGSSRLNDFYILTSTSPFTSGSLSNARANANNERLISGQAGTPTNWTLNGNTRVRYVRVQRRSTGHVTIAEVQVMSCSNSSFETKEELTKSTFDVVELFPNPTSGEVISRIDSDFDGEISIQVVDMIGQVKQVKSINIEKGNNTMLLNVDHLANGMYHVIFTNQNQVISKKIVKVK